MSTVKEVMGHVDISTTMRYVHATDAASVERLKQLRRGARKNLPQKLEKTA